MNTGNIERPITPSLEQTLHEFSALREGTQEIRTHDRILLFEEAGGTKTVTYDDVSKETLWRSSEGEEYVIVEDLSLDERSELDSIYDTIREYEDRGEPTSPELDTDKSDDFFRDAGFGELER